MNEPLKKNKKIEEYVGYSTIIRYYNENDVKSAVEWLRNKIRDSFTTIDENGNQSCEINMGLIDVLIDEAFEDVIENEK